MEHLYVAPDHRRSGIGELMEQAKERRPPASGSGCSSATAARGLLRAPRPRLVELTDEGREGARASTNVAKLGASADPCARMASALRPRLTTVSGRRELELSCRPRMERAMTSRWISLVPS